MCVRRKGSVYCIHKYLADSELVWKGVEWRKFISHIFNITLMLYHFWRGAFVSLKRPLFENL